MEIKILSRSSTGNNSERPKSNYCEVSLENSMSTRQQAFSNNPTETPIDQNYSYWIQNTSSEKGQKSEDADKAATKLRKASCLTVTADINFSFNKLYTHGYAKAKACQYLKRTSLHIFTQIKFPFPSHWKGSRVQIVNSSNGRPIENMHTYLRRKKCEK